MRRTVVMLSSALVLLLAATAARADTGSIDAVVATPQKVTFTAHVDWSSCLAGAFPSGQFCGWFATVRVQDADTECLDPAAGRRAWQSQQQSQPAVIDVPVAWPFVTPGQPMTLCLWVYSASVEGDWVALARADVAVPPADPPWRPPSVFKTPEARAKATAVGLIGADSPDTANISADCTGGPVPVCRVSWTDRWARYRGRVTLGEPKFRFVGQWALLGCLEHEGPPCWKRQRVTWDPE